MKAVLTLIIALSFTPITQAQNYDNGAALHGQKCSSCHDTGVYTRQPRRVNNLPALGKQVRFCKDNLGISWFDDQVNDVIFYLNKDYYHF